MRVAIIGSRNYSDKEFDRRHADLRIFIEKVVQQLTPADYVVSGAAAGADWYGEMFAQKHHVSRMIHEADWNKYGKSAGPIRNALIVRDADIAFAFYSDKTSSWGTLNCVGQFLKAGKTVYEFDAATEEKPKWLNQLQSILHSTS